MSEKKGRGTGKPFKKGDNHGKPFAKGTSGNPGGRPAVRPEVKAFRALSYNELVLKLEFFCGLTRGEMQAELKREDASMFDLVCGNMMVAAARGEKDARREIFERLWGKVKDSVEFSTREVDERLTMIDQEKIVNFLREAEKEDKA